MASSPPKTTKKVKLEEATAQRRSASPTKKQKLWGGRFTGATDPLMEQFNASIHFDKRMYDADIRGSKAYVSALKRAQLLTEAEEQELLSGLEHVRQDWAKGQFKILTSDEDIHTANERQLQNYVGTVKQTLPPGASSNKEETSLAGKLHTGRSRNDQVATDLRLWLKDTCEEMMGYLKALVSAMVDRAEAELDALMPGYTHLQRAQPIRWSHLVLSHAWSFQSDATRLEALLLDSKHPSGLTRCPLGSGALAGNPFPIDRQFLSRELGFANGPTPNSLLGVGDRDVVADFLHWATMTMVHVSRWSEDLIVYSSSEFGFVTLADAYSTGSSLMPQKKNPDSLELLRGKVGRVLGGLMGFLTTYKGLPSTYNKDLQEDKEPLFDAADTLKGSLQILTGVVSTLTIHAKKMEGALSMDMLATDLAEYLVRKGVPFRDAHHVAGAAVKCAEDKSCQMSELSLRDFQSLHPAFTQDITEAKWWSFERSVESRNCIGGTSRQRVMEQISSLKEWYS